MDAEETKTEPPQTEDASASFRETHRPFVRELNRSFASVYGFGGAAVLVLTALVPIIGWYLSALSSPITWSVCVTVFLVSIFVLRAFVRRRARRYRTAIDDYCTVNEIDPQRLREAYIDENMYPYFEAIFETIERREELLTESNE